MVEIMLALIYRRGETRMFARGGEGRGLDGEVCRLLEYQVTVTYSKAFKWENFDENGRNKTDSSK